MEYDELLKIAEKSLIGYNNSVPEYRRDLTLYPEDVISNTFIILSEKNEEYTIENFKKYVVISIKQNQKEYTKGRPWLMESDIQRLNTWKTDNPDYPKEYCKRNSKKLTARASLWNTINKEKYKENWNRWWNTKGKFRERKGEYTEKTKERTYKWKEDNPEGWKAIQDKRNKKAVSDIRDSYVRGILKTEGVSIDLITPELIEERRQRILKRRQEKAVKETERMVGNIDKLISIDTSIPIHIHTEDISLKIIEDEWITVHNLLEHDKRREEFVTQEQYDEYIENYKFWTTMSLKELKIAIDEMNWQNTENEDGIIGIPPLYYPEEGNTETIEYTLKELKNMKQEVKVNDVAVVNISTTGLEIKNTLLDNIKRIKEDAGYIPQANAINMTVQTYINVIKAEVDCMKIQRDIMKEL